MSDKSENNSLLKSFSELLQDKNELFYEAIKSRVHVSANTCTAKQYQTFYVSDYDNNGRECAGGYRSVMVGSPDYLSLTALGISYDTFLKCIMSCLIDGQYDEFDEMDSDLLNDEIGAPLKFYGVVPDVNDQRYIFKDDGTIEFWFLGIKITYKPLTSPKYHRLTKKMDVSGFGILDVLCIGEFAEADEYIMDGSYTIQPSSQHQVSVLVNIFDEEEEEIRSKDYDLDLINTNAEIPLAIWDQGLEYIGANPELHYPCVSNHTGWLVVYATQILNISGPFEVGDQGLAVKRGDKYYLVAFKRRGLSLLESMGYYYHWIEFHKKGLSISWNIQPSKLHFMKLFFKDSRFHVPSHLISIKVQTPSTLLPQLDIKPSAIEQTIASSIGYDYTYDQYEIPIRSVAMYMGIFGGENASSPYFVQLGMNKKDMGNIIARTHKLFPGCELSKADKSIRLVLLDNVDSIANSKIRAGMYGFAKMMRRIFIRGKEIGYLKALCEYGVFSVKEEDQGGHGVKGKVWRPKKKK